MDSGVYERDGYMVIEDVLDLKDLSYYQNELDAILEPSWAGDPRVVRNALLTHPNCERFPDNPLAVYHIANLMLAGCAWAQLSVKSAIVEPVRCILGDAVDFDMMFARLRPPGVDLKPNWHKDILTDGFIDQSSLTVLVYLSDVDSESGATWVIPRKSELALVKQLGRSLSQEECEHYGVPIEVSAGSVVLLGPSTLHRGGWSRIRRGSSVIGIEYRSMGNFRPVAPDEDLALCGMPLWRPGWIYDPPGMGGDE